MKATYESQGSYSYLVYELEPEDIVDTMSLGMITNNKIAGLIPVVYTQMDNKRYIKYNITAKVSIRQFFEGIVNKQQILSIFLGIVTSLQAAEEYMIDVGSFLLDMDYIYTDVTVYGASLICLPVENMKKPLLEFREFFKNIVFTAKFAQAEDSTYVGKLINFLSSTAGFSLVDFRNLLEGLNLEKGESTMKSMVGSQEIYDTSMPMPAQTTVLPQATSPVQNNQYVRNQTANTSHMTTSVQGGNLTQSNISYPNMPPMNQPQVNNLVVPSPSMATESQISQPQNALSQNSLSQGTQNEQERISLMKLLIHYNKDNAHLYKEQKKRDKEEKASGKKDSQKEKQKESKEAKKAQKSKKSKEAKTYTAEFAIPGEAQTLQTSGTGGRQGVNAQPDLTVISSQPVMQQPMMQQPVMQQPMMQQPVMQQPMMQHSTMQQPMMQQPLMQQPGANGQRLAGTAQGSGIYGAKANFGETTVLGTGNTGETTVLNAGMQAAKIMPFLIRVKTNESIPIDKPVFRIGKEKSYVDYFINDNTAISRSHANIITREGRYWVVDTNSTNHTYVGGQMIASNTETEIVNGSRLTFANEEFEFKIM